MTPEFSQTCKGATLKTLKTLPDINAARILRHVSEAQMAFVSLSCFPDEGASALIDRGMTAPHAATCELDALVQQR